MNIKLIDGFTIRNSIDINFSVIGDKSVYPYIKTGEVWFDKNYLKEKDFFINLFKKRKILTKKYGYEVAKKMLRPDIGKITGFQLKLIQNKGVIKIYLVNGPKIRQNLDPNFCFGGHWQVYNYIPEGEVWIDNVTPDQECKYVIIHELYELELMSGGKKYTNAHDFANAAEKEARRNDGVAIYLDD